MRFRHYPIGKEPYQPNPVRRLAAAKRHLEAEKAKVPMFANQMVTQTPEERVEVLNEANRRWLTEMRSFQAGMWWKCRHALQELSPDERGRIIEEWDRSPYPGDAVYLADFLRSKGVLT